MAWLPLMSLSVSDSKLRELAHDVASRTQAAVESRVGNRLAELELSEARGYVRARSSALIRREVDQLVQTQPRLQSSRKQLQHMASEVAIRQVVWHMLQQRKEHQPSTAALRRAA